MRTSASPRTESVVFAHVLAYAHSRGLLQHVVRLNLIRNSIGDEGMLALAGVLRQGCVLRGVWPFNHPIPLYHPSRPSLSTIPPYHPLGPRIRNC
jgi:hypothetical protein